MVAPLNQYSTDYFWTSDGDFFQDGGDVARAGSPENAILYCSFIRRIQSSTHDWNLADDGNFRGIDLWQYRGLPNTQEVHDQITRDITTVLTDLVDTSQLNVETFPISAHTLLVLVFAASLDFPNNREPVILSFDYDLRDNKVFPRIVE
jgi:hypothetical protein